MTYNELAKCFLFGGAVYYQNQRCHVIGTNDLTGTVTLKTGGGKTLSDIEAAEVKHDQPID